MRAGLVFVVAALLAGGGFREWRRSHEERFQDLVAEIEERDARRVEPESSDSVPSRESSIGAPARGIHPGTLDPDRASARELERLPGIGPALAARIVADRNSRGPFRAPEALLRVSGIGPRTLERIRAYLEFGPPAERASPGQF